MMEVQTLDAQFGDQRRQGRVQLVMGNRNIEIAVFATPCESQAAIIPRLKQPDHTIEFVADQRGQIVDVLLHAATVSMRNKQPSRPCAAINARQIHRQPKR